MAGADLIDLALLERALTVAGIIPPTTSGAGKRRSDACADQTRDAR